ncbi:MAG: replication factor C large subunit [Candidatus Nanoarchaeia archaeon]
MLWTEKYKPKTTKDIYGHDKALQELKSFVMQKKKGAVLIYGATGNGKTSAVHALANEMDYELLEVNASDKRNKENINMIVGTSSKQMSLFKKGKVILIDEVDGITGQEDRGGIQALIKIVEETRVPIIITSNDPFSQKISPLRAKCKTIEFATLSYLTIANILRKICENEGIKYDEEVLKDLARRAGGDARAAINDLQILTSMKKTLENLDELGEREQTESILNALKIIFKSKKAENVLGVIDKTDLDLEEALLWIDENLPREYQGQDLIDAYEKISRADVFNGRIRRWQHWDFLIYINALLTAGVATSKKDKNGKFVSYKRTGRVLKLWQAKMKNAKRDVIAEKLAAATHTSKKRAIQELPYLKLIFKKGKGEEIAEQLELCNEEIEWLSK